MSDILIDIVHVILKFETILKYHEWYLCQIPPTNHPIIILFIVLLPKGL